MLDWLRTLWVKDQNSLNLVGDGDDVDILYMIEETFGIHIEDAEAEKLMNVGDLYDLIEEKIPKHPDKEAVCFSAYTFYRIRRAIKAGTGRTDLSPKTEIKNIIGSTSPSNFKRQIENLTGFKLPELAGNSFYDLGVLTMLGTGIYFVVLLIRSNPEPNSVFYFAGAFLAGKILCAFGKNSKLAKDYETLGGLAKATAAINYGKILKLEKDADPNGGWHAIEWVLRNSGEGTPPKVINRETTFFAE